MFKVKLVVFWLSCKILLKSYSSLTTATADFQKSLFFFSQICPPTSQYPKVFTGDGTGEEVDCKLPEALKHIEEKCHDQQVCSLVTAPEVFGPRDPCPGFRKYVEVAYKCKPTNFRSRTACQGDTINITCSSDQVQYYPGL